MPGSNSRRRTRRHPLSERYENAEFSAAIEESKKIANKEKKNALEEELAFHRASEESRELKELQNSEALAIQLQANENKQLRNGIEKQKRSNYMLAKKLQKKSLSRKKTNAEIARNLQIQYNKEADRLRKNSLRSGPYEEEKESDPPTRVRYYIKNPVRLPRTRSKTVARPKSKSVDTKSKRWWPF
jgi:hypothetical protein